MNRHRNYKPCFEDMIGFFYAVGGAAIFFFITMSVMALVSTCMMLKIVNNIPRW